MCIPGLTTAGNRTRAGYYQFALLDRERVSQLARCGEGCFDLRRRVNSTVRRFFFSRGAGMRNVKFLLLTSLMDLPLEPNITLPSQTESCKMARPKKFLRHFST